MNIRTGIHTLSETTAGNGCTPDSQTTMTDPFQIVRVLGLDLTELAPCHPARARELIRKGRATRIAFRPYTIQLLPDGILTPVTELTQTLKSAQAHP